MIVLTGDDRFKRNMDYYRLEWICDVVKDIFGGHPLPEEYNQFEIEPDKDIHPDLYDGYAHRLLTRRVQNVVITYNDLFLTVLRVTAVRLEKKLQVGYACEDLMGNWNTQWFVMDDRGELHIDKFASHLNLKDEFLARLADINRERDNVEPSKKCKCCNDYPKCDCKQSKV